MSPAALIEARLFSPLHRAGFDFLSARQHNGGHSVSVGCGSTTVFVQVADPNVEQGEFVQTVKARLQASKEPAQ